MAQNTRFEDIATDDLLKQFDIRREAYTFKLTAKEEKEFYALAEMDRGINSTGDGQWLKKQQ